MSFALALVAALVPGLSARAEPASLREVREGYARSEISFTDRHGELLQEIRRDHRARRLNWVPLAEVSPALREAVVLAEDHRFAKHGGVDWLALGAAAWSGATGGKRRGGSTITMQLAGFLAEELRARRGGRDLLQKWNQIQAAREIERGWTKEEILEAYLNLVSWRGELQGVQAAARGLFAKDAHGLDRAESLLLASLLRAPNARPEAVAARACALAEHTPSPRPDCASLRALAQASLPRPLELGYRANLAPQAARLALARGATGAQVRSSLDARLQRFATETLRTQLAALAARGVRDGAVLVIDNASGEVLAYVANGGAGFSSAPHVDGIQARRQAGSSLKPFLYALAFERRLLSPETLLDDAPVDIPVGQGGVYHPLNYDKRFHGPVSVATALGSSLNVPAVRTLMLVGVDPFRDLLARLGFRELMEAEHYGPSLALGAVDVSLWDLVGAYRTLARGGLRSPLRLRPEENTGPDTRVIERASAAGVSKILGDPANRAAAFGFDSPLGTPARASVKTGTSKDMRDNWCVGYTEKFSVGVWVGNFNGDPMQDVSGVTGAGPVWSALMTELQPGVRAKPAAPTGVGHGPSRPLAHHRPRIVYPAAETVFAIDPDIPEEAQKLFFESSPAEDGRPLRWFLNEAPLAEATGPRVMWAPRHGRYRLELRDAEGGRLDTVEFTVRGRNLHASAP